MTDKFHQNFLGFILQFHCRIFAKFYVLIKFQTIHFPCLYTQRAFVSGWYPPQKYVCFHRVCCYSCSLHSRVQVYLCALLCVVCALEYGIEIVHFVNRARPNTTPSNGWFVQFFVSCLLLSVLCCCFFFTSNQFLSILSNKNIEKWFPRLEWIRE